MVGPSNTAPLRRVAELTTTGETRMPFSEYGRLLGLGAAEVPTVCIGDRVWS